MSLTHREIVNHFRNNLSVDACVEIYQEKYSFGQEARIIIKNKFSNVKRVYERQWKKFNRSWALFQERQSDWLKKTIDIPAKDRGQKENVSLSTSKARVQKSFVELSDRSKRRKVSNIISQHGNDLNMMAAVTKKCASLQNDKEMSKIMSALNTDNTKKRIVECINKKSTPISPKEGLALMIKADLSKNSYNYARATVKSHNSNVNFPPYNKISEEKSKCYPPVMNITASSAESPWHSALPFTIDKIVESKLEDICETCKTLGDVVNAEFKFSAGLDGSGGQKKYNQELEKNVNESSLVAVSFIGLQIVTEDGVVLFLNQLAHSSRSCRTQKIFYGKENKETIVKEYQKMKKEIQELENHVISLPTGQKIFVKYTPRYTLSDGKVCSHVVGSASYSRCDGCNSPPSFMNRYEEWKVHKDFKLNVESFELGFHPLHRALAAFRYIFNLSCRLLVDKTKSQARGEDKEIAKERKKILQARFEEKLNLRVEEVRADGGTSTTGNVVRKAFFKPEVLAEILEIDSEMVRNLSFLLRAISMHYAINVAEFKKLCDRTLEIINEKYSNIPLNPSTHFLLVHGVEVINASILPVGYFSEEASESKNKYLRNDRERHARKDSREHTTGDVFKMSWIRSCPVILANEMRSEEGKKASKEIPDGLAKLLVMENTQ